MRHAPAGRRTDTPPRRGEARLEVDDARTLAALYNRHAAAMYSLAIRIAGEPADAGAVVRGVFAAAWSEAGRGHGHTADAHWLLATTRIRAIDHVRASESVSAAASATADGAGNDSSSGARAGDVATLHIPTPVQERITNDDAAEDAPRLRAAFRRLPPLERLAIELAYFEGRTLSQIAARLEHTRNAANARLRTGLRRLAGGAGAERRSEPRHDVPPTRDLAALYALGALNASERAAFDAHLEVHRETVNEVLSLLPVTRRLAWTPAPHEPPTGLRERVIETVTGAPPAGVTATEASPSSRPADAGAGPEPPAKDGPELVDTRDARRPASTGDGAEPVDASGAREAADPHDRPARVDDASGFESSDVDIDYRPAADASEPAPLDAEPAHPLQTPTAQRPTPPKQQPMPTAQETPGMQQPTPIEHKSGRWGLRTLAGGSLVIAAGFGWFAAQQANLATALQENLDAANTQARIAEMETAAAQQVAGNLREAARVLTAADVQPLDLAGQPAAPDARGRLFLSASDGALFTATGLPPVPPGRVYQLWLIPDTTPMNAALLAADAEGRVMVAVTPPDGVTEPLPVAVTLEPAGGVTTPGGDVYLLGRP